LDGGFIEGSSSVMLERNETPCLRFPLPPTFQVNYSIFETDGIFHSIFAVQAFGSIKCGTALQND